MERQLLPIRPVDKMVNEDVAVLTSGARTKAERLGYRYAEIERRHNFRFLFDPKRILLQRDQIDAYLSGDDPFPTSVEIDPSNACNHDCVFCIYASKHSKGHSERLPTHRLLGLVDELVTLGVESMLFVGGGEPLTHPATVDAIERAGSSQVAVGLVTNGSRMAGITSRLKRSATYVRVSLDAADPRTHLRLHRRDDHALIMSNLARLASEEGGCTVGTGFFINESNVDEIVPMTRLVKDAGADYIQFKSYSGIPLDADLHDRVLDQLEQAIELDDGAFDVHIAERIFDLGTHQVRGYSRCHWQQFKPIIGADGNVVLCAQKRTSDNGIIGNVLDNTFEEVWRGAQRRATLAALNLRDCPYCVHHAQNTLVEFLSSFDAPHGEFF